MKVAAFFLLYFLSFLQVKASGQLFSLSMSGGSFEQFTRQVELKTGFRFVYVSSDIPADAKITLDIKNAKLEAILQKALDPYQLTYVIREGVVVISKAQKNQVMLTALGAGQEEEIRGVVMDENGMGLEGAEVGWKGTKIAMTTGRGGRFSLKRKEGADIIRVSYIGYTTVEMLAESGKLMVFRMLPSGGELDRVEIIAYGTTTRRLSTGNIASVKAADIERQPVPNPLLALQGRVPGLLVTQGSGNPGSTVTVRIQGTNSLLGSNDPFYVVDGVPFTSSLLATGGNDAVWGESARAPGRLGFAPKTLESPGSGNPFSYLNPADIESIEVLKDADATAIYGSRAGNGAILITTKRGKSGAMSVDFNLKSGRSKITRRVKLLNTQQYLQMRKEGAVNSGIPIGQSYDVNGAWDTTRYTDWQDEFLKHSAGYLDGQLSISGGNNNTSYSVGLGFHKETTMLPSDFSDKKMSGHVSLRSGSGNQKFKMTLSTSFLVDNNRLPASNITTRLLYLAPNAPALRNPDGSVNWAYDDATGQPTLVGQNPFADLLNRFNTNASNLISNLTLGYTLLPGLEVKASLGYTRLHSEQITTSSFAAIPPTYRPFSNRQATFGFNNMESYIVEPQATYRVNWKRHKLDFLAGGTIQQNANDGKAVLAEGQNNDAQLFNLSAAGKLTATGATNTLYKYIAGFGRLGYNYEDKYLLNLTVRRDGSTRFGPGSRFHSFGAVGMAWVLSKERFINLPSVINFMKLKFSYGSTGNDRVGDYSYMDLYQTLPVSIPYQGVTALTPTALVNNTLQWELTKKMNAGIDIGFLQDRVLLGFNYARNRSSNLLQNFVLPYTAGFASILRNFPGVVQNTSWEVTANVDMLGKSAVKWNANVNFTVPKNKLLSLPDIDKLSSGASFGYTVGKPLGIFLVYKYAGIDPQTGVVLVEDAKGNPTATPSDPADAKVLMNLASPFYAGMSQSVSYKAFRVDIMFQFVKQKAKRYLQSLASAAAGGELYNQPALVLERWQKPGDLTNIPKFQASGSTILFDRSDMSYEDASYVRVKNVALSAEVPSAWMNKVKVRSCRIAVQVQNLLTFTRYSGLDPETGTTGLPPFRTIVLGIQFGF